MALMEGVDGHEKLTHALTRCREAMSGLRVGDLEICCSAGAALFPAAGESFDALYKCTDLALYEAKRAGKSRYVIYTQQTGESQEARLPRNRPSGASCAGRIALAREEAPFRHSGGKASALGCPLCAGRRRETRSAPCAAGCQKV